MLDSNALTKIRSIILIAVIAVAGVGGFAYVLFNNETQSSETVKIGVLTNLDSVAGKHVWQGTILAAEELNNEGGILGREVEVIAEDTAEGTDALFVTSSLNRLIGIHEVDFIIMAVSVSDVGFACQEIIAENEKVTIAVSGNSNVFTQRVLDDYDKYKYFFRTQFNATSISLGMTDSLVFCRELTGFNKVGYLGTDAGWTKGVMQGLDAVLPEVYGFDLVYKGAFPYDNFEFSSYFAAAEAAGTEILLTLSAGAEAIPIAKEYYDRQSPMIVFGGSLGEVGTLDGWDITDGKCNHMAIAALPITVKYPLTSKTVPVYEAYFNRWNQECHNAAARAFDSLKYILADAIERAGTIEADAVVEALEETKIETTMARNFVFTESHDLLFGEMLHDPDAQYAIVMCFQWQNGEFVPVFPKKIMEEAGATLTFPDWPGPWDNIS